MRNVTYINAGAGSGKTYRLTQILADLIKQGKVEPERVIMTTFTNRAADDMRRKAKEMLFENGLTEQATRLDQALIGTVHSIANTLINKYWFRLGLSPDMGVMAEEDTTFYISQSLANIATDDELKRLHGWADSFGHKVDNSARTDNDFWQTDLKKIIDYTTNYEIKSYERSLGESLTVLDIVEDPSVDIDIPMDELRAAILENIDTHEHGRQSVKGEKRLEALKDLLNTIDDRNFVWFKRLKSVMDESPVTKRGPLVDALTSRLAGLWRSRSVINMQRDYVRLLFTLAERWREQFVEFKRVRNMLDYNDMERYLRDLLADEGVAAEIAADYRYLLVDEFQDCSPIQVKIFDRMADIMEHSYWVGDYKQAIYGFRGSDIALTKAVVDRVTGGEAEGCDAESLPKSWRSVPEVVNVCNNVFRRTFAGVLPPDNITLEAARKSDAATVPALRYWRIGGKNKGENAASLAMNIARLLRDGVPPEDVAVLARRNDDLDDLATELSHTYGIPVSRESIDYNTLESVQLVGALLDIVTDDRNTLAKSKVAFLTEEDFDTRKLIESKLLHDADDNRQSSEFLDDVPLVRRVRALRAELRQQSVASLVSTLVIELNLESEVKKFHDAATGLATLKAFVAAAARYEEHCLQMSLPATLPGFVSHIANAGLPGIGDTGGVQLWTYHGSKGLEKRYVILTSLNDAVGDDAKCLKREVFGVHYDYIAQPTSAAPFPEVYIRILPFIYGSGNTAVPSEVSRELLNTELFNRVHRRTVMESNRLLYVGMTRPRDVMILALKSCKNPMQWFHDIGLEGTATCTQSDLFGTGDLFADDTMDAEAVKGDLLYRDEAAAWLLRHRLPAADKPCMAGTMYVSPSTIHATGPVLRHWHIGSRMGTGSLSGHEMSEVGDCLHHIYCNIEQHDSDHFISDLIEAYGLTAFLTDVAAVRTAWENLTMWLEKTYGFEEIKHEVPFIHRHDGQVYTGSIDLVWDTGNGIVVLDFKTCPLGDRHILDSADEHFAGRYAGQLHAYARALSAAGRRVLARLVYYPVSGLLVEVGAASSDKREPR